MYVNIASISDIQQIPTIYGFDIPFLLSFQCHTTGIHFNVNLNRTFFFIRNNFPFVFRYYEKEKTTEKAPESNITINFFLRTIFRNHSFESKYNTTYKKKIHSLIHILFSRETFTTRRPQFRWNIPQKPVFRVHFYYSRCNIT